MKRLTREGIHRYWSRNITVKGTRFWVSTTVFHRRNNSIPVDLYVERDLNNYARSMNPAILGIDAIFIYNNSAASNVADCDNDFRYIAAHEFGHSVLMYAGGIFLSWGHKGTTNPILQKAKKNAPGYPKTGPIDVMKYYDGNKMYRYFADRILNYIAMEIDIKRLIWAAPITWAQP